MLAYTIRPAGTGCAEVRFSERHDGDFGVGFGAEATATRSAVAAGRWTMLRQCHGSTVVSVARPGDGDGLCGDAAVTTAAGAVLAIRTADCAPVAIVAAEGVVAAVHAGWRGVVGGVIQAAAAAVREHGGVTLSAVVGPCIHADCYEFEPDQLHRLANLVGPEVISVTAWGTAAFDIPAGVRLALADCGVTDVSEVDRCTACDPQRWFSHRARGEASRLVMATWLSPT